MMTPFISIATQAASTAYEMNEIDKLNSIINGAVLHIFGKRRLDPGRMDLQRFVTYPDIEGRI